MKRYGLAGAGKTARGMLSRLPIARDLGPVASTSYRLAAYISNSCRMGIPARCMSELNDCEVILMFAAGHATEPIATLLSDAQIDWPKKVLLICDSGDYSVDFPVFRERGGATGSLNPIEGFTGRYVVEGDKAAVHEAKLLVRMLRGRPVEVPAEHMPLYSAALTLSTSLCTPLLETCMECIRQAQIEQPHAAQLLEALFSHSLRTFMRAGRKNWRGPVAECDRAAIARQCRALEKVKPLMASYFQQSADYAFDLYRTFPELTRYNRDRS